MTGMALQGQRPLTQASVSGGIPSICNELLDPEEERYER